jgi:hypothetical protein
MNPAVIWGVQIAAAQAVAQTPLDAEFRRKYLANVLSPPPASSPAHLRGVARFAAPLLESQRQSIASRAGIRATTAARASVD